MRVLRDDNTEVDIMETVDYQETDLRSIIEGDHKYRQNESFGSHGYSQQEFNQEGEIIDISDDSDVPEMEEPSYDDGDDQDDAY